MSDLRFTPALDDVLVAARQILQRDVEHEPLRESIDGLLSAFARAVAHRPPPRLPPLIRVPALVHAGVTGEFAPALPLCAVALLLYLGIDILDDLMDGDETTYWRGETPGETLVIAATLTSALPHSALSQLDVPASMAREMELSLSRGLLRMAAGQRADLLRGGSTAAFRPGLVEFCVGAKSGQFADTLAALGAQLAGASHEVVDAYRDWAFGYGTADQLRSDCLELLTDPPGTDLKNGTLTYPLACLLEATPEPGQARLRTLIADSSADPAALAELRRGLKDAGALSATAALILWHVSAAERALARAGALEPARTILAAISAAPGAGLVPDEGQAS